MSIEVLDEIKDVMTNYGAKAQGLVKVTNGIETSEKKMNFNQPMKNYLINKAGKDSKKWIGQKVLITTKFIQGNDAIIPLTN